ncbi:CD225/dispanin family protein [Lacinutrix undariae]
MENRPQRPSNYLALAIISTVMCCLPSGIVSIVYSSKVNTLYEDGRYEEAERASKNAKTWGIVSIVVAAVGILLYLLIFGIAMFGAIASSGGDY